MRRILKTFGFCLVLALSQCALIANGQTEPDDVIRVDTNLVNLFFSAVDKDNRFMTSFERSDIAVYEDGVRQEILTFQKSTDRPLSLTLLIDISGSEKRTLIEEKIAAKSFLDAVIRRELDHVAVISFAADPFLEQSLTNNIDEAKKAIDRIQPVKGVLGYQGKGTVLPAGAKPATGSLSYTSAIWDALWITSRHLFSPLPTNIRRVMVIVTDGEDTSSRANLDEAIDITLHTDTVVYAIGVGDTSIADGVNKSTLSKIALRTGGQFFLPRKNEDLTDAFEQIANELRNQYLLSYIPLNRNAEPSYRRLRIEIGNAKSQRHRPRLFYRPGYYFRQQTAQTMNTHRLLALTICIAALNASQTVFSQSKVKSSLCTSANSVETIREQIEASRTFDDNRQRLRVLLRSADLLWPYRRPAARAAFAEAFEQANLNFKNKDPKKENPASAPDQRYLVISAIAKRDLDWATKLTEQLLKEEAKQVEEAAAKTSQDDLATAGKLLDAALYLLPSNVNAAIQFARRSFSFPASLGLPIFLYKLAELDQPAADRLYGEAVAVYRNKPMNEFLYLSAYPFGNDREAGDMPTYASYRVPSAFVRRNALQRLFLETLLLRSQQTLANIQPVPTQALDTRQIWLALTRLEPQVQQFLPDLLAATQQTREAVFTHLSPDSQARLTRSIANQNQPKKSFDEQVEAAEKQANVDERDRLLVFAVLGVSETEPLDRVLAVAEKISDSTIRRQLLDWIYFGRSRSAIKDKQFVEARRRASKVEELDQRAYLYSQIAEELLKTIDDQTQARELLEEVIAAAAQAPNTIVTARTLLAAAFLYTKVDMNRAVSVIGDAIKSINRLTAPDFSRPVVTRKIEGKEFGAYATFQTPGFDPENALRALGKIDFDTAFYQVSSFEDKYLRALTRLTLAEQCLEPPRPQQKK